jgi:hypothetical protein
MSNVKTESRPEKQQRGSAIWIPLASALAAFLAAAAAGVAAYISSQQVDVADQQNTAAEQQQLLTLTTTITQELDQGTPSTGTGSRSLSDEIALEAQSAEAVISELRGNGVTSVEYCQIARALTRGTDANQAITYFQDAVNAQPHDVGIQQEALRLEGDFYYTLGQPVIGHDYIMRSIQIYSPQLVMSQFIKDNEDAQAYLDDASDRLNIHSCTIAAADIAAAERLLSQAGGENPTNRSFLPDEQKEYSQRCS